MNRYEIDPEYKILRYLQTQTENYNVTPKDVIETAGITSAYWHKEGLQMITDGIIGKKDSPEYGLTLTKDGHKRLDYFANLIIIENEQEAQRLRAINAMQTRKPNEKDISEKPIRVIFNKYWWYVIIPLGVGLIILWIDRHTK